MSIHRTNLETDKAYLEPIGQDGTAHVFDPNQNKRSESMEREEQEEGMVRAGVRQRLGRGRAGIERVLYLCSRCALVMFSLPLFPILPCSR